MPRTLVAGAKPTQRTLVVPVKPDRWLAKDARTDAAMVRLLFEVAELCSQFRAWKRAAQALDAKLDDPALLEHPGRPAAVQRWETAVDRCARIELSLWDLAPAAAAAWLAYSPVRRAEHVRRGWWPPPDVSIEDAVDWLRGEWISIVWKGVATG